MQLLHETASGYCLFDVFRTEEIGLRLKDVQEAIADFSKFGRIVKLKSFAPFQSAAHALENVNDISEGIVSDYLKAFLEMNVPKGKKKNKAVLGLSDKNLAGSIKAEFPSIECDTSEVVQDLLRGVRYFGVKLLKQLQPGDLSQAQLGLGHSYSRAKVKFNVNRSDNMIIQAIALLDQLDKDVNTFSMRMRQVLCLYTLTTREWYSWHFPELSKLIVDSQQYARLARLIQNKTSLSDHSLHDIAALVGDDSTIAQNIIDAAKISMGQDISDIDLQNVVSFADRVISLADHRKHLHSYLVDKMNVVAPNLAELIGEVVGARLISHAGSLTNLAKYPASTLQILGAEKALFRALKTKGNTPKYGLIYHSSFIGRAGLRNKGRISRFLANKCSIASRIDNFADAPSTKFGQVLRRQVEERLSFYESGVPPTKNADAMKEAMDFILASAAVRGIASNARSNIEKNKENVDAKSSKKEKKRKRKSLNEDKEEKPKKLKRDKKERGKKKRDKREVGS